jgi:hypothetical protein
LTYEQQGISLWLQLQKELSPDYEVLYFSQKLRKVISHPSELMAAEELQKRSIELGLSTPIVPRVKKPARNLGFTKKLGKLTATPRSFVTRTCKKNSSPSSTASICVHLRQKS